MGQPALLPVEELAALMPLLLVAQHHDRQLKPVVLVVGDVRKVREVDITDRYRLQMGRSQSSRQTGACAAHFHDRFAGRVDLESQRLIGVRWSWRGMYRWPLAYTRFPGTYSRSANARLRRRSQSLTPEANSDAMKEPVTQPVSSP